MIDFPVNFPRGRLASVPTTTNILSKANFTQIRDFQKKIEQLPTDGKLFDPYFYFLTALTHWKRGSIRKSTRSLEFGFIF